MRVLCYLNISASKNILCDSGLIQTAGMIEYILSQSKEYHFYLWLPNFISIDQVNKFKEEYPILKSPHVTITYVPISPIRRMTPYDFRFRELEKCANFWKTDYDVLYNGLPEYTENLSQLLCRNRNLEWGHAFIPIVNRLHWIMANDYVSIPDDRIELKQCAGMVMADYNLTLCNYTVEMVEAMRKRWFPNQEIKTQALYNGIEVEKIIAEKNNPLPKTDKIRLLYPNRLQGFKNPMFMLESLIKLRQKRQDFELILTDPTADYRTNNKIKNGKLIRTIQENLDWIKVMPMARADYYRLIHSSDVVINTSDYETWCLVITEALTCGKNVVVPSGLTFEEMINPDYPFIYTRRNKKSFLEKLELAMAKRGTLEKENIEYGKKYAWSNVGKTYLDFFEQVRKKYILEPKYKSNDRHRLLEEIKKRGKMTKKEIKSFLGPGEEKCWTKYRWYLLQNGVKDTYDNSMPTYYVGEKPKAERQKEMF